jgi:hypothetical protein
MDVRRLLRRAAIALGAAVLIVAGHLALIEVGREVVTLRTPRADGRWQRTRLWIVDDGGSSWLHSAGADWVARFEGNPVVEVERGGELRRYRAVAVPGPHPRVHELLRRKYGVADRWVRFVGPDGEETVAVRLDPL